MITLTLDQVKVLERVDKAFAGTDDMEYLAASDAMDGLVHEMLAPLQFSGDNPMLMTSLVKLAAEEIARLAKDKHHMYQGVEIAQALLVNKAACVWEESAKNLKPANDNVVKE